MTSVGNEADAARIISACDTYSAMTTNRPYRAALPAADAVAELERCSGSQFDPAIVDALLLTVAKHPEHRPAACLRRCAAQTVTEGKRGRTLAVPRAGGANWLDCSRFR